MLMRAVEYQAYDPVASSSYRLILQTVFVEANVHQCRPEEADLCLVQSPPRAGNPASPEEHPRERDGRDPRLCTEERKGPDVRRIIRQERRRGERGIMKLIEACHEEEFQHFAAVAGTSLSVGGRQRLDKVLESACRDIPRADRFDGVSK